MCLCDSLIFVAETRNLLTHLGAPINETSIPEVAAAVDTSGKGDIARLPALLEELVKTERSYLSRIRALKSVSIISIFIPQSPKH